MTLQQLAVEIGGTFTDIIQLDDAGAGLKLTTKKVPSTPARPEVGVLDGVDQLEIDWANLKDVLHGSTVATNAVLERKGVPTALFVTRGFRDILEIQRGDKTNIYDIFYQRPQPVVPREWVVPVGGRLSAQGEELAPLNEQQIRDAVPRLLGRHQGRHHLLSPQLPQLRSRAAGQADHRRDGARNPGADLFGAAAAVSGI